MSSNKNLALRDYYTIEHKRIAPEDVETLLAPVMIVGSPRSGTTWLQRLLLESAQVCGGQESYFYALFNELFVSVKDKSDGRRVGLSTYWGVGEFNLQVCEVWVRTFLPMLKSKPTAAILLEKTPFHALFMDEIIEFLPKTKFIHLIRDSRAVTASLNAASNGWGRYWAPQSTKKSALEWYRHVKAVKNSNIAKNKQAYLEVHYEDLLTDPVEELRKIFIFLEVPIDEKEIVLAVERQAFAKQKKEAGSGLKNSQGKEIKEPEGFFRKGVADAWKKDLNIVQKLITWRFTRKLMKECGYDWSGRNKAL